MNLKKQLLMLAITTLALAKTEAAPRELSPSNPNICITNKTNRTATKIKINIMFRNDRRKVEKGHIYLYDLPAGKSVTVNVVENAQRRALTGKLTAIYVVKTKAYFEDRREDKKRPKARQKFEPAIKPLSITFIQPLTKDSKHFAIVKIG